MTPNVEAIFFDLDDTLIDRSAEVPPWPEFTHVHLLRVYEYISDRFPLPPWPIYLEELEGVRELMWADHDYAPTLTGLVRETLRVLEVDSNEISEREILAAYDWSPVEGVRPFSDAASTLCELERRGYRLGLVTNSSEPMWMRDIELEYYGLIRYFPECRVASSEIGRLKPRPEPFEAALRLLGIERASSALFVGDRLESDIRGAQRVGMQTALLLGPNTVGDPLDADHQLERLSDLLSLLR